MTTVALQPLPWQQTLWVELTALAMQGRLAHALLIAGPAGIGKRHFARALTAFLLCEQRSGYACGQCRACAQLAAATHPDANLLSVDGHVALTLAASEPPDTMLIHWEPRPDSKRKDISIGAVHSAIEQLTQISHYGGARVVLIEPADLLNESSANALLKLVEEPPKGTHLLFVCERPSQLKPTLRSRCQRIRMTTPRAELALDWLQQQQPDQQTGGDHTEALAEAGGAPLRALELMADDGLAQRRAWRELWMAVAKQKQDPLSAAAKVDKEQLPEHLRWASAWLLQLLRSAVQKGEVSAEHRESVDTMLAEVLEAQRRAAGTASAIFLLESLLVQWLRLGRKIVA